MQVRPDDPDDGGFPCRRQSKMTDWLVFGTRTTVVQCKARLIPYSAQPRSMVTVSTTLPLMSMVSWVAVQLPNDHAT